MSDASPVSPLAPFRIRNFRYQWPADLATSWAFEMETLILGWYVLVETQSVMMLTVFASLQYIGTLVAPLFGVIGDRIGHRNMLCAMRSIYATLAITLMTLALTGWLRPVHVFVIAALMGLVRPSDQVMRYSLIGAIMPADRLMVAIGIARTTSDSARVVGALLGAGISATLGIGPAYAVIATFYTTSLILTLKVKGVSAAQREADSNERRAGGQSAWGDLKEGVRYVWTRHHLLAAMCLAFLVNMTAFPLILGLMPYVAREIFHTNQAGLGYLVASFAAGALSGSLAMTKLGSIVRPARTMLVFCALWYVSILVFARMPTHAAGCLVLLFTGAAQSMGMVAMSTLILRSTSGQFRARVMGLRMLAIYGLPIGLLIAGQLITLIGYPWTATLYCILGIAVTTLIAVRWRKDVWHLDAPANAR